MPGPYPKDMCRPTGGRHNQGDGHPWKDFSTGGEGFGGPCSTTHHWGVGVAEALTVIHPPNVQTACTREDLDRLWAALPPYLVTICVLSVEGLHVRSAAMHTLDDVVYRHLRLAREAKYVMVTNEKKGW